MLGVLLAMSVQVQQAAPSEVLPVEEWVQNELLDSHLGTATDRLLRLAPNLPRRGRSYLLQVDETGTYHIDLRSYFFDAYLILRNSEGREVAEDDDGLMGRHARLQGLELLAGKEYQLWVCSVQGNTGPFELICRPGPPEVLSTRQRDSLYLEDLGRGLQHLQDQHGEKSARLLPSLKEQVFFFWRRGRSAEALPLARRAVEIATVELGLEHRDTALAYYNLGSQLSALSRHEEALEQYRISLEVDRMCFPPLSERIMHDLEGVCRELLALGRPQEIVDFSAPVFADLLATADQDDPRVQSLHIILGPAYRDLGNFVGAEAHYRGIFENRKRVLGPEHVESGVSANNLAQIVFRLGHLKEGEDLFRYAYETLTKAVGADDRNTLSSLGNLGTVLWTRGLYHQAEPVLRQVKQARERLFGLEDEHTIQSIYNLAAALHQLDRNLEAEPLLGRVIAFYEKTRGMESKDLSIPLGMLGNVLIDLGRTDQAGPVMERGLRISELHLGPDHPMTAYALSGLGGYFFRDGRYELAQPCFERILDIRIKSFGPDHPSLSQTYTNLGAILDDLGDAKRAEESLREALRIAEASYGGDNPLTALTLGNLSTLLYSSGRSAEAEAHIARKVAICRSSFLGPDSRTASALRNLALILLDQGKDQAAFDAAQESLLIYQEIARSSLWMMSEADGFSFLASARLSLDALLAAAVRRNSLLTQEAALHAVVEWKGQIGRAFLGSSDVGRLDLAEDEVELLSEIQQIQGLLSRMAYQREVADPVDHARKMQTLQERKNVIETQLNRSRDRNEGEAVLSAKALVGALPRNGALIEFYLHPHFLNREEAALTEKRIGGLGGGNRLSAWVLRADGENPVWVDLGPVVDLQPLVRDFLRDLVAQRGGRTLEAGRAPPGLLLKKRVFDPLLPFLNGIHFLALSPDSFLATLPFEVLADDKGRFLIEDFSFLYLHDLRQLSGLRKAQEAETHSEATLLAVGGVDYNRVPAPTGTVSSQRGGVESFWTRLPQTDQEAQAVVDLFQANSPGMKAVHLRAQDPGEARLKAELAGKNFVHLATHGFFAAEGVPSLWDALQDEPGSGKGSLAPPFRSKQSVEGVSPGLLSGLVCAGANQGEEDGLLTAEEVQWLDLSAAELVVLSACETGLGRQRAGEGMMSLRRAFHLAGARTVVSSLWKVNDSSTQELMQGFYQNLWLKGQGRLEALRNAQLEMLRLNRAVEKAPLPSTWGAFVLSGEWR